MTTILFTDLDNTLIHSLNQQGDMPAEQKNGRIITWINPQAQALLDNSIPNVRIVPTTARSINQYTRVTIFKSPPRYAITSMGAVILRHGKPCRRWAAKMRRLITPTYNAMNDAIAHLCADKRVTEAQVVNEAFLFACTTNEDEAADIAEKLKKHYDCFTVLNHRKKIYIIPKGIDKRTAVREVVRRLTREKGKIDVVAAGDSIADVSFLADASRVFVPSNAMATAVQQAAINNPKNITAGGKMPAIVVCPAGVDFATFILKSVTQQPSQAAPTQQQAPTADKQD
jgi:hydroxymethylpyrimidine pyrophosphatase-like HAD family hydrolase